MTGPAHVLSRRELLRGTAFAAAACLLGRSDEAWGDTTLASLVERAPRARFWAATAPGTACATCHTGKVKAPHDHGPLLIKCLLCAHGCVLAEGERGKCRARIHVKGELRSLVYGRPMAIQVDPIEKKPFYHFLPSASAYSLSTSGCPLRCKFCQNFSISQAAPEDYDVAVRAPTEIAAQARGRGAPVIAFTYNEPTVFAEYLLDIARAAREQGVRSVLVSCGYMQAEPLAEMCQVLSAIKIDLKGITPSFYRDVSGAELAPVLRTLKQIARTKVHLEVVNLVVPTLNDSEAALRELPKWVAGELGPDVPLHFTRFHPDYLLPNLPRTPVATLEKAYELGRAAGLRHVYVGNVPGHPGNTTFCPKCRKPVIERSHMFVTANRLVGGRCPACKEPIAGVWS